MTGLMACFDVPDDGIIGAHAGARSGQAVYRLDVMQVRYRLWKYSTCMGSDMRIKRGLYPRPGAT